MYQLLHGDAVAMLRSIPGESIHCVVTSPPYYGMRSYLSDSDPLKPLEIGLPGTEYGADLVGVFREVKRVLRNDGTLWLNIGDTYEDGQLLGLPWIVARCLQQDGWILRQDIIWSKKSPMPESTTTRCTRSHEYVFMFAKSQAYFYDAEAIKEPSESSPSGKNRRSVWSIGSTPYAGAHFATMPTTLAEYCIAAGTSERGCCDYCGSPFKREVEKVKILRSRPNEYVKRRGQKGTGNSCSNSVAGVLTSTVGWSPSCKCDEAVLSSTRCTVLDPFAGSGTTLAVAESLGRDSIGIELNAGYIKIAEERVESCR